MGSVRSYSRRKNRCQRPSIDNAFVNCICDYQSCGPTAGSIYNYAICGWTGQRKPCGVGTARIFVTYDVESHCGIRCIQRDTEINDGCGTDQYGYADIKSSRDLMRGRIAKAGICIWKRGAKAKP